MPNSQPNLPSTQTVDLIRDHVDDESFEAVGLIFEDGTTEPLTNQARSASRFFVNPSQLRETMVERFVRGANTDVWGIYHSHILPGSTSQPSDEDVNFMQQISHSWDNVRHVIVTDSDVAIWVLDGDQPQRDHG